MNLNCLPDHLVYTLNDNSDWEYTREGVGVYKGRVFVVDLNDTGERERQLHFVEEGLSVHDVIAVGVRTGRYGQCPAGSFYYDWDAADDEKVSVSFKLLVGI